MADGNDQNRECLWNSRGRSWEDEYFKKLLEIMKEETIFYSADNAKTPKEKRPAYREVHMKFEKKKC